MNQEEKIEILLSSIQASIVIPDGQEQALRMALIDGLLKLAQLDAGLKKAVSPYRYYPVELLREGYAIWNCGGFWPDKNKGSAIMAAGYDGSLLKVVRTNKEKNGKHVLCLVYQGCFLAEAKSYQDGSVFVDLYQIVGFSSKAGGTFEAKCKCLYNSGPKFVTTKMANEWVQRLSGLIESVSYMSLKEDNVSTDYRW